MARMHQKQQTWPHTLATQASAWPWQVLQHLGQQRARVQQLAAVGRWRAVAACLLRVLGLSAVWQLQVDRVVPALPGVREAKHWVTAALGCLLARAASRQPFFTRPCSSVTARSGSKSCSQCHSRLAALFAALFASNVRHMLWVFTCERGLHPADVAVMHVCRAACTGFDLRLGQSGGTWGESTTLTAPGGLEECCTVSALCLGQQQADRSPNNSQHLNCAWCKCLQTHPLVW